jgi:hypothetical protein
MASLDTLSAEYPGDAAWRQFVGVFLPSWLARSDKNKFVSVIGDSDFAVVLSTTLGDQAVTWFQSPIKALDGMAPAEVLTKLPYGQRALRTMIMRMPR